ncbi:MAG TPA: acyl-CoA dehydrogenase, partial [Novosphingobium sp.]
GTRGISLFVVPKYLVGNDGEARVRNDLRVVSIEHKLGIHASPTCVMSFGDNDECIGELVGAENEGLRYMFTMMNSARINVGAQGVEVAEAAFQHAAAYARQRIQSARASSADKTPVAIIEHPDVRRMLLRMRTLTEATRALLYFTAGQVDRGAVGLPGAQERADVLVPMLKAWGTDAGCEVASLGLQIHGGMGYIEETGAAQFYRDARIAPIYEGTNGIQAIDLVTRKLAYGQGAVLKDLLAEAADDCADAPRLAELARACIAVADHYLSAASLDDRLAGSVPFCTMCAVAVAGWQVQRQARHLAANGDARERTKRIVARFHAEVLAVEALGLRAAAMAGADMLYTVSSEELAG